MSKEKRTYAHPILIAFHNCFFFVLCYVLGWIWSKESQKEIEEAKVKYEKTIKTIQKDLNVKYRQTVSENLRETAQLELDQAEGAWLPSSPGFPESAARGGTPRHEV